MVSAHEQDIDHDTQCDEELREGVKHNYWEHLEDEMFDVREKNKRNR